MKKPFLVNAEPFKTDVKPVLSRGIYDVFVGAMEEDKLPMYIIINRDTSVIEFTHEVISVVNEWLDHFLRSSPQAGELNGVQEELGLNS